MWFKKKTNISGYNANTAVDGTDWRTTSKYQSWTPSYTLPSAADAGNYFYLPALGYYYFGQLVAVRLDGNYWSSSAHPQVSYHAYYLYFTSGTVDVTYNYRLQGLRVDGFE